jgi:hypothetical protein
LLLLITASSCVSYPKIAELPPIPQYTCEKVDWDTSAKCVVIRAETPDFSGFLANQNVSSQVQQQMVQNMQNAANTNLDLAVSNIIQKLEDQGYQVVPEEKGYLTRSQRKAVDKVVQVDSATSNYVYGGDGTCTDAQISVTVYDIAQETIIGVSAVSRIIGQKKEKARVEEASAHAVENLFTLSEFRRALTKSSAVSMSGPPHGYK